VNTSGGLAQPELLKLWPESNSPLEESLLYCANIIALEQDSAEGCRQELRRILGDVNYQHLVAFIAYEDVSCVDGSSRK